MTLWKSSDFEIKMWNEPCYTAGSADNPRSYDVEHILGDSRDISNAHGLSCSEPNGKTTTAILLAPGGATGVHEHSVLVSGGRCFVAVGAFLSGLSLPNLRRLWCLRVDHVTCFGVHATSDGALISHGELAIAKVSADGRVLWTSTGADIFSEVITVTDTAVFATDSEGRQYRFALRDGSGR